MSPGKIPEKPVLKIMVVGLLRVNNVGSAGNYLQFRPFRQFPKTILHQIIIQIGILIATDNQLSDVFRMRRGEAAHHFLIFLPSFLSLFQRHPAPAGTLSYDTMKQVPENIPVFLFASANPPHRNRRSAIRAVKKSFSNIIFLCKTDDINRQTYGVISFFRRNDYE